MEHEAVTFYLYLQIEYYKYISTTDYFVYDIKLL